MNNAHESSSEIEYIELTEDLEFDILKGRSTILEKGVPGFLLDESNIYRIADITAQQKEYCLSLLDKTDDQHSFAALIQGFPCLVKANQFVRIEPLKSYPIPNQII